ncbi:MAG: hypothetical protein LBV09_03680 [Deferribacteraceae bacterium]|jgi:DNA-binding transcriptional MerR regulator|nr:hypothetical protein [Deferribacteraceae bacterium]
MPDRQVSTYLKLIKQIDATLDVKRISYAQFSHELDMPSIAFYNKYKAHGFSLEEMERFLALAQTMPAKTIECIKCGAAFIPKTKSVKRAFCEECKEEMRRKVENSDSIRFKYPSWITNIHDSLLRNLVEQEFHIDEETAAEMAKADSAEEAKAIRSNRWKGSTNNTSSVVYDTMTVIKF